MKEWVVRVGATVLVASGAAHAEPVQEQPAEQDPSAAAEAGSEPPASQKKAPDSTKEKKPASDGAPDEATDGAAAPAPKPGARPEPAAPAATPSQPAAPAPAAPQPAPATAPPPAAPAPNPTPRPRAPEVAPTTKAPSQADDGADSEEPDPPPFEESLGVELMGGVNVRLSDLAAGYQRDEPTDITLGLGVFYAPSRKLAFGVSYARSGLGAASALTADQTVSATYDLNVIGLNARLFPVIWDKARLFVGLGVGPAWQNVSANGARRDDSTIFPAEPYQCSASGFGFSLGASAGVDYEVEPAMGFVLAVDGAAHRLSGEMLDGCAFGAGGIVTLAARFGFQYRFDLAPKATPSKS